MRLSHDEHRILSAFVADKTGEGVLAVDTAGAILFANEGATRILGQSSSMLCQYEIFRIAPEMVPVLWKELWKEIRSTASFSFEFQFHDRDERPVQVDMTAYRVATSGREVACLIFHDVEERKRLQLLHQEFVTNVSHELRTPMTVIREGISQVLEGLRGDVNETQKRALGIALSGIERMGRMIDDLLDISKMESGKIVLKRERLDLVELARDVAGAFQDVAEDRGLDLRLTTPAGPVMIYGDRDRLVQVITNLVGNAFKYTEKGHIQIEVSSREDEAECAISDSGIGIAKENLEKVFAKFEQLGQVSFTGEKGTGLGLSISRGIVELHKGRIWAESGGVGSGSRMVFSVPRQTGQQVFVEQLSGILHDVARRGGSLSVLIFRLQPAKKTPQDLAALPELLSGIEHRARKQTGRLTDLVVIDKEALYVALQSTVRKEAMRVAEGVEAAVANELGRQMQKSGYELAFEISAFPEDRATEKEFLLHIGRRDPV